MEYCSKCGNKLRQGANFCPKCGTPVGSKGNLCENTSNFVEESNQIPDSRTDGKKRNKIWMYGSFVIVLLAFFYMYGQSGDNGSNSQDVKKGTEQKQETKQKQESIVERPIIEKTVPTHEEKPTMQNDEEFQRKTMEYVSQIQQIMTEMNNVYNRYIASRSSDMMGSMRVNAQADLSDLNDRGDEIFNKMISLARQKQYQEAVDAFKQEKESFDAQWRQMARVFDQDMY